MHFPLLHLQDGVSFDHLAAVMPGYDKFLQDGDFECLLLT